MSDLMKEIGERIKHYRKAKGMTQKELGEKVGCHEGTIRQYENGLREPRKVSKLAIARALDVSYDRLFSQKDGTNLAEVGTDCISRQAAIKATWQDTGYTDPFNVMTAIRDRIQQLPSAQPEIIRCKDCKHRDNYGCCKHWKGLAMGDIPIATDDNDFCSYGER